MVPSRHGTSITDKDWESTIPEDGKLSVGQPSYKSHNVIHDRKAGAHRRLRSLHIHGLPRVLSTHTTAILFELYTGFTASAFIVLGFLAQNQACGKHQHHWALGIMSTASSGDSIT